MHLADGNIATKSGRGRCHCGGVVSVLYLLNDEVVLTLHVLILALILVLVWMLTRAGRVSCFLQTADDHLERTAAHGRSITNAIGGRSSTTI